MTVICGPVLSFRGEHLDHGTGVTSWVLSALVVSDGGLLFEVHRNGAWHPVNATLMAERGTRHVDRFDFMVGLSDQPGRVTYRLNGSEFEIRLPVAGRIPRMAYVSCNGYADLKSKPPNQNSLWDRMHVLHGQQPFHLLLCGGDQVYADSMRLKCNTMSAWEDLAWDESNEARFTPAMAVELEQFYFDLYCSRWSQPAVARMLARVPMVAMWDDHDIIDGWGSYPEKRQNSEVMKGLFSVASAHFRLFQQQIMSGESHPLSIGGPDTFSTAMNVGGIALVVLDMRSERTERQVMSETHWQLVYAWLRALQPVAHLFVMSSIPVIYPSLDALANLLGWVPGQQELEDDLRDHWNSQLHRIERLRFIHHLIEVAERGIRPTLLSGDVHVAAIGHIETQGSRATRDPALIYQLISSGIVHPPPPGYALFALKHLLQHSDEVEPGIVERMTEFPGTSRRFIGARNFLCIGDHDNDDGRVRIEWIVEELKTPFSKVIHPIIAAT